MILVRAIDIRCLYCGAPEREPCAWRGRRNRPMVEYVNVGSHPLRRQTAARMEALMRSRVVPCSGSINNMVIKPRPTG